MRTVWVIAAREFNHYFISPIAYIVAAVLFLILGYLFSSYIYNGSLSGQVPAEGTVVIPPLVTILIFATPALTMRLLADEQRMGTMELLLTAPVRDWELVVGKWLGSLGFMLVIILITWVYPLIVNRMASPGIDQGVLISSYVGLVVLVGAMLAIGTLSSAIFTNPVVSFFATLGILLGLWIVGSLGGGTGLFSQIANYLGLMAHYYENLFRGILDLGDVIYYLSLTALSLFLSAQVVESRRWR